MTQPPANRSAVTTLDRIRIWASHHQPYVRLVILASVLSLFLTFLPSYIRGYFWDTLVTNRLLEGMILFFCLVAISLVWSTGQKIDSGVFLLFNLREYQPIWLDRLMLAFTQIGSGFFVLGIALLFFWTNSRILAYELALGTLMLWLVVELLKFMIQRPRPFISMANARIVGYRAGGRSFPSGHTSQAFFLASLLSQHFHSSIGVVFLLYLIAFLVGITRMYVGAHYPRDVLAGAILGSAWGLMGVWMTPY
jgi:membrane-associated phospholipid phosphatase